MNLCQSPRNPSGWTDSSNGLGPPNGLAEVEWFETPVFAGFGRDFCSTSTNLFGNQSVQTGFDDNVGKRFIISVNGRIVNEHSFL